MRASLFKAISGSSHFIWTVFIALWITLYVLTPQLSFINVTSNQIWMKSVSYQGSNLCARELLLFWPSIQIIYSRIRNKRLGDIGMDNGIFFVIIILHLDYNFKTSYGFVHSHRFLNSYLLSRWYKERNWMLTVDLTVKICLQGVYLKDPSLFGSMSV